MNKISVRYNGTRYPRTVNKRHGTKVSFFSNRQVLELEEYDALMLLSANQRLMPGKWEFTVEMAVEVATNEEAQELLDKGEAEIPEEAVTNNPTKVHEKPKAKKPRSKTVKKIGG